MDRDKKMIEKKIRVVEDLERVVKELRELEREDESVREEKARYIKIPKVTVYSRMLEQIKWNFDEMWFSGKSEVENRCRVYQKRLDL